MLKRLPITFWATVFVTLVCVSLVGLDFWRSWNARAVLLEQTERSATNLARAMSQHADDTIKSADTSLKDLEERIETDGMGPDRLARLHRVMQEQVRALPQLDGLYAYDAGGRWIVNALPAFDPRASNADREYFRFHRENADKGPHIGLPVISRSSGKWVIPVSRRIDLADGRFGGVVLATIDIDYFRRFYASFDIGTNGAVALLSNRGVMLVRRPFRAQGIGTSIVDTPLYRAYSGTGTTGIGMFRSTQDGELRLNSYRPLQHYPLFVTAALSKEDALAHWRRDTLLHSLGVLLLAGLLALFGQRLIGQMRRRLEVERELRDARDALAGLNATLEKMALQDGLTGLANRRQLDVSLGNEFSRAVRQGSSLALALIDVDHFQALQRPLRPRSRRRVPACRQPRRSQADAETGRRPGGPLWRRGAGHPAAQHGPGGRLGGCRAHARCRRVPADRTRGQPGGNRHHQRRRGRAGTAPRAGQCGNAARRCRSGAVRGQARRPQPGRTGRFTATNRTIKRTLNTISANSRVLVSLLLRRLSWIKIQLPTP
ncbi:sensor domain-containing diguanylate cyclase [Pseudoduganella chitinolytica]|uniref:sensor domain-containing diguanylate cyclase n=1 Tax=Pseudoduganella chitinolytica TaxID=34070 RepID=UPI003FCCF3B3